MEVVWCYIPYRCVHSETCRWRWCGAISLTDAYTARRVDGGGVLLCPLPMRTQRDGLMEVEWRYVPYRCVHSETCRWRCCGAMSLTDAYTARRVDGGGVALCPLPMRTQRDV